MKTKTICFALASVLALSSAAPVAMAQTYRDRGDAYEAWRDQQEDYQREQREYEEARRAWEARQARYSERQRYYEEQRSDYERARAQYERDRAEYDRRNGYGAYVRRYGEWRYVPGRGNDYYAAYRDTNCERRRDNRTVVGGLIGALAGAAIGSNVAESDVQTEGAVLGAVVGGVIGGSVGRSTANCDDDGYYYSYDQTYEYRESGYYRRGMRSGRYDRDYYVRNRCRLAVAPTEYGGRTEYRYVRVCPDRRGRYRITS